MADLKYEGRAVTIATDRPTTIELPPRVALARLVGMVFDVDRTFVLPAALGSLGELVTWCAAHPDTELLVVGHTDARGDAHYNEQLSRERARAVAAFLTDDVDAWLARYDRQPAGQPWGLAEDQRMLGVVAGYDGNIDGRAGAKTAAATRRLQAQAGLPATGTLDRATRRALIARYLARPGTSLPRGTPITTHGAGAHKPLPEVGDAEQRRVEVFVSDGPFTPAPDAPAGPAYDRWRKQVSEQIDLTEVPHEIVELALAWPAEVVDRLPDDFTLTLSGDGLPRQQRAKAAGLRDGELVCFEMSWLDKGCAVELTASAGGRTITLWRAEVAGDLSRDPRWLDALTSLLPDREDDA